MRLSRGISVLAVCLAACASPKSAAPPTIAEAAEPPKAGASSDTNKLPGVDLAGFDPTQVKAFDRLLDEKPSPCGKSHSLRTSLKSDPKCKRSVFAARYIVTLLKAGLLGSEAEERYDQRFGSSQVQCDLSAAPMKGNTHAPVVLCVFSDFQCPHCKLIDPIVDKLIDELPDQVRVYYKAYPISKIHPEATEAAAAALAAGKQNKFWPMHDKLFAHQEQLALATIERYAAELKLDVKKWKADLTGARAQVEKDHAEGEKLDVSGTPTLFINGRKYAGPLRYDAVKDWVEEELNR